MRGGDSGGDNPLDDARIMRARSGDLSRHDDGSLAGALGVQTWTYSHLTPNGLKDLIT